jgi:hypothetical protein
MKCSYLLLTQGVFHIAASLLNSNPYLTLISKHFIGKQTLTDSNQHEI